jgi:hypothetical protein
LSASLRVLAMKAGGIALMTIGELLFSSYRLEQLEWRSL